MPLYRSTLYNAVYIVLRVRLKRMLRQKRGGVSVEKSRGVAGADQRGRSTECNVWRVWRMHGSMAENVIVYSSKLWQIIVKYSRSQPFGRKELGF